MIRAILIDLVALLRKEGAEMADEIRDSVPVAEGELRDSIGSNVEQDGSIIRLKITAADHFRFVELGRKKGKFPPLSRIKRWCEVKKIPVKAAFPIAKAIAERGIPPKHILKKIIPFRERSIQHKVDSVFREKLKIEAKNLVRRYFPAA